MLMLRVAHAQWMFRPAQSMRISLVVFPRIQRFWSQCSVRNTFTCSDHAPGRELRVEPQRAKRYQARAAGPVTLTADSSHISRDAALPKEKSVPNSVALFKHAHAISPHPL